VRIWERSVSGECCAGRTFSIWGVMQVRQFSIVQIENYAGLRYFTSIKARERGCISISITAGSCTFRSVR
jgi:hypothetical protein